MAEETGSEKQSGWYWVLMVVLGALLGWFLWNKPQPQQQPTQDQAAQTGTSTTATTSTGTPPRASSTPPNQASSTPAENAKLRGRLYASDNPSRGNLMLLIGPEGSTTMAIYINTQRDFASLVGRTVDVTYTGTTDHFTMESISEAADDGR